jgi:hypothetical protein
MRLTSRMGPSGSSPILMVVHSCWVNAEPGEQVSAGCIRHAIRGYQLSRLGLRACSCFCFCAARDGVLGDGSGELGELEYDDGEDPASGWPARCRCSGIVMAVGVFSIVYDVVAVGGR